ncbi:hypothetical protein Q8A67_011424 [Cirrhinus molitorella]|uniref:ZP-N domain-containing protein n=1 Tax=Cirrhinus molitorella TaxID=172907 RepID=A0AA88PN23_9TELE|nr:hypothetical protein Q8A67_011424 [Cirrhinus molitorella]
MIVNSITRIVLCSILGIFSSPTRLNSVSSSSLSLLDERTDRPRTAREKHPGKLLVRDLFTNTPDLTRHRPVPVLRIRGRTPARVPPGEDYLPKFTRLPDVSVTCSRSGFVLKVKKNFYGFSAVAEELTLGETCKSNGVLEPHNDLLFTYALNDCQGEQQVFPDAYKYVLNYVPLSHRNSIRYHRVNVGVECRYKSHFCGEGMLKPLCRTCRRQLKVREKSGKFTFGLEWEPFRSAVYLLGQQVNVQVSTRHHYRGVKLFINGCYAATVSPFSQVTKHSIIDNYGLHSIVSSLLLAEAPVQCRNLVFTATEIKG